MKTAEGFNPAIFRATLLRNLAVVGVIAFGGMAGAMIFGAVLGLIAMMAGELAALHVLAMIGMAAGFGVMAALCEAIAEGYGVKMFAGKEDVHERNGSV